MIPGNRPSRTLLVAITNSAVGGIPTWAARTTEVLPSFGWEVVTVTHALDEVRLVDWATMHPGLVVKPLFGRFVRVPDVEAALHSHLERVRPDVVMLSTSWWMLPALQQRKRRGGAMRILGVCHVDHDRAYLPLRRHADCLDGIVAVSATCHRKSCALGLPPNRVTLLPHGVPGPVGRMPRPGEGPLRLAYAGRLVQRAKRVLDFVPLVRALDARRIDDRLDIYGTGADEAALRRALGMVDRRGRVTLHGPLPANDVVTRVWPGTDVFVQLPTSKASPSRCWKRWPRAPFPS